MAAAKLGPQENLKWFNDTLLMGRSRPKAEHRKLYEWVEDEVNRKGFVQVKEVREKAGFLIDATFEKYKKFRKLGYRVKKLLCLKSVGVKGKQKNG